MTDREKIIEEMKLRADSAYYNWDNVPKDPVWRICEGLYDAFYRKVPEGAVVLTKEDWADTQARVAYLQEELGKLLKGDNILVSAREYGQLLYANENARKETAMDIIKDLIGHRFAHYEVDEKHGTYRLLSDYVVDKEDVKFFEDKYGVEVEE